VDANSPLSKLVPCLSVDALWTASVISHITFLTRPPRYVSKAHVIFRTVIYMRK
jgi:hypothetical protein